MFLYINIFYLKYNDATQILKNLLYYLWWDLRTFQVLGLFLNHSEKYISVKWQKVVFKKNPNI